MFTFSALGPSEEHEVHRFNKRKRLQGLLLIAKYNLAFYTKHYRYEEAEQAGKEVARLEAQLAATQDLELDKRPRS